MAGFRQSAQGDCSRVRKAQRMANGNGRGVTRRGFLKASAVLAVPAVVPSSVFGADAPSERVGIGCIGTGNQGEPDMKAFMNSGGSQVVALCDVDRAHLEKANQVAKLGADALYKDFRELIARSDVDAVCVATPDHWHAIPSIAAIKAGKDVYCEKPLTLTIAEGRAMADAAKRYGRVLQTGSQQRSDAKFRQACEIVRNGLIGDLKTVQVNIPGNNRDNPLDWKEEPVP